MKIIGVCVAWALATCWLASLMYFPAAWKDFDGLNQVSAAVGVSALMFLWGIAMLVASHWDIVRARFATILLLAPLFHLLGTFLGLLSALVFFTFPSGAILVLGLFELLDKRRYWFDE